MTGNKEFRSITAYCGLNLKATQDVVEKYLDKLPEKSSTIARTRGELLIILELGHQKILFRKGIRNKRFRVLKYY